MKRKKVFSVIIATLITVLLNGCSVATAAFDQESLATDAEPFSFPVKFYLKEISADPYKQYAQATSTNILITKKNLKKIRDAFVKYYPELFTVSPAEGLEVAIRIKADSPESTNVLGSGLNALLSLASCMIIPVMQNSSQTWHIEIRVEKLKNTTDIKILQRQNVGLFGTALLLPGLTDHCFKAKTAITWEPKEDKMKDIVRFFVNELYTFPPNDIQELYVKTKVKRMNLLD